MTQLKRGLKLVALSVVLFFAQTAAAAGLVPCSGGYDCTLCDLLKLIVNIANFMVKDVLPPLAGLLFLIGGIMMVVSAGSEERYKKGKQVLVNTAIGVVIVLGSWVIVNTIIVTLGKNVDTFQADSWWNPNISCRVPNLSNYSSQQQQTQQLTSQQLAAEAPLFVIDDQQAMQTLQTYMSPQEYQDLQSRLNLSSQDLQNIQSLASAGNYTGLLSYATPSRVAALTDAYITLKERMPAAEFQSYVNQIPAQYRTYLPK